MRRRERSSVAKILRSLGSRRSTKDYDTLEETRDRIKNPPESEQTNTAASPSSPHAQSTDDTAAALVTQHGRNGAEKKQRRQTSKEIRPVEDSAATSRDLKSLYERIEILMLENERVEATNHDLGQALSDLQEKKQNDKQTIKTLKNTNTDICSKFEALVQDLNLTKTSLAKTEEDNAELQQRIDRLEEEKNRWTVLNEEIAQERSCLEHGSQSLFSEVEELRKRCEHLQRESDTASHECTKAKDELEEEMEQRKQVEKAAKEGRLKIEELTKELARIESLLISLQSAEEQREKQLRDASDTADVAEHERLLATKGEAEMSRQVEILTEKLQEQRNEITTTLQSECEEKLLAAKQSLRHCETERSCLNAKLIAAEMKIQEMSHENALLEKRIEQLTSEATSTQICCSLTGISVQSVAELDRIQKLEFERQKALDDLEDAQNKHDIRKRSLETQITRLQLEAETARSLASEAQHAQDKAESESAESRRFVASIREDLKREKAENTERVHQLEARWAEFGVQHKSTLEDAEKPCAKEVKDLQNRLAEALNVVKEKTALQSQWEHESVEIAQQLETLAQRHRQEYNRQDKHIATLTTELKKAQQERDIARKSIEETKEEEGQAKRRLNEALRVNVCLEQHLESVSFDYGYLKTALEDKRLEIASLKRRLRQTQQERDSFEKRYTNLRSKEHYRHTSSDEN